MISAWLSRARESFWFLPAVLGAVALVTARAMVVVDRTLQDAGITLTLLDSLSADGGRAVLTAIAGSVLTVAATSFSITISVMATTSSVYGPRLVRNFMADRANQWVLATFTATFLYALVVLGDIQPQGSGESVPTLAIHLAIVLAVVNVAVLVFFIHHIAQSVQVTTLEQRVRHELETAVDRVFPADPADHQVTADAELDGPPQVRANGSGHVEHVDLAGLVRSAKACDGRIELVVGPGDHVIEGEPLARVRGDLDGLTDAVRTGVVLGPARTPHQDVGFAVQDLTEMAVRALSQGANDPYTAASALDALGNGLVRVVSREPAPRGRTDADGTVRLVVPWPTAEELVRSVVTALRTYGVDAPVALDALLRLLERLEEAAERSAVREAIREQVEVLRAAYVASEPLDADATPVLERMDALQGRLGAASGLSTSER
ncbi:MULTISPECIES: DUF2254 domain-containing protein [unclassified Isoptericola]|uniref:DUF2254 domain-containing protein n=1 Tax=unclassified Isoptericola TaxID=2623355 RepID=UPI0027139FD1|nr:MULTISPECIES: DUF2254 domain-containing protein [unclassified Isoptericola]MDO8147581.1 DUF2254 domain-containing protein [Isoptericola sp. b515]MDO8150117.1 DUF2254 domain-containing protein [Isoptericola sp. b408]